MIGQRDATGIADRHRGGVGDVLVRRGRGYLLRVDRERLDAALFQDGFTAGRAALEAGRYAEAAETLREALDLWRSQVLADLADYAFTRPEAARLEDLRLTTRGPDRSGWGTGWRTGERGQPNRPCLRRRLGLGCG